MSSSHEKVQQCTSSYTLPSSDIHAAESVGSTAGPSTASITSNTAPAPEGVTVSDTDGGVQVQDRRRRQPCVKSPNQTVPNMFASANMYERRSSYHQKLTRSVTNFICKYALPIYTVEKTGFKSLLAAFDPRYLRAFKV